MTYGGSGVGGVIGGGTGAMALAATGTWFGFMQAWMYGLSAVGLIVAGLLLARTVMTRRAQGEG